MVPFWTSFIVRTYGIFNLIGDSGPLARLLESLGIIGDDGLHLLFTPLGVAIGIIYSYLPLMILPLYVALERIDPALLDAANDLGAAPHRVLRRVILPLAEAGHRGGLHPRRDPGDRRVRHPADPRRRQDAHDRQRRRRPVPEHRRLPVRLPSLAIVLTAIVMIALVLLRRGERGAASA